MNEENKAKKKKIIVIAVIALILILGLIVFLWWRSKITATTMRILRMEGTVTLEDDGKEKTITSNLRLNSGNALATAIKSLVSIGLDDTKIVTLDQSSRAEFNQSGRKLELELTAGSLFFEVQKPLEDDESFDISTSTMVVGIRGTSGWVSVEGGNESLIVTDGHVHVIGTNPVTGEVKEIDVKAGQRITVYLYNDRKVDSIMFELEEITERDLPDFVLERLRENRDLLEKVCLETNWDKPWILGVNEEEMSKIIMNSDDNDESDRSSDENDDTLLPDTGEEETEETKKSGPLTKEQLAWAHSHIAIIDPNTGIFALKDMTLFDPAFYAATNPDVVDVYGTDPDALLYHYLTRGKKEGRPPIAPPTPTPTITPTWGIMKRSDDDDEQQPEVQKSNTVVYDNTVGANGFVAWTTRPAQVAGGSGRYQSGMLNVTGGTPSDPTKVILPYTIDTGTNHNYEITGGGFDGSPGNVTLDQSILNTVKTVEFNDYYTGWAGTTAAAAKSFMNTYSNLTTVKSSQVTFTKHTSGTNATVSAVATPNGNAYNTGVRDVETLISGMDSTYNEVKFGDPNNQQTVTYSDVDNKTHMTYGSNTYENITITKPSTTYIDPNDTSKGVYYGDLKGDLNGTNTVISPIDYSGKLAP